MVAYVSRGWEHYPHEADIGLRGFGASPAEAFEQTALALTAALVDPNDVAPREPVEVACSAPDLELLLVEWLNTLVFEMATRRMLFARFEVHIEGTRLHGTAWGESLDPLRHAPATEAKGATYTDLSVRRSGEGWRAQCVVDV